MLRNDMSRFVQSLRRQESRPSEAAPRGGDLSPGAISRLAELMQKQVTPSEFKSESSPHEHSAHSAPAARTTRLALLMGRHQSAESNLRVVETIAPPVVEAPSLSEMDALHAVSSPGTVMNIASAHPPIPRRSEMTGETSAALRKISRSEVSSLKAGELAVALPPAKGSTLADIKLDPRNEAKETPGVDTSVGFEPGIDEIFDQVWVKVQRKLSQTGSDEDIQDEEAGIRHHNIQSIVVTSWLESEGTSTVALGLAGRAAATLPGKICLVDADFHGLGLTRASRCESRPGLAELLLEEATLDQVIVSSRHSPFVFIPAGRKLDLESLATDARLQQVIRSLEDRFRYVFYDTSSLKRAAEAYRWGRFIVNTILVIRAGVTRQQTILHAVDQLQLHGMQLLGTVLNQRQDVIPNWLYPYV
ncbi:hypothetical protein K2Y11_20065 [bacterium]|nr:hypothetical protein [bacterium]